MIRRLLWQLAYARLALASGYDFTLLSAWQEASVSWGAWDDMRGDDPMPTPADAIYEDRYEWGQA